MLTISGRPSRPQLAGPPSRTRRRGRPRAKGTTLPSLTGLAQHAAFAPVTVTRYCKTATVQAAAITCLWYSVLGARKATVVIIRDTSATGYDPALVTTDLNASPAQVIERYAARWSIEVAIEDSKQVFGSGQARNRTAAAVRHPPGLGGSSRITPNHRDVCAVRANGVAGLAESPLKDRADTLGLESVEGGRAGNRCHGSRDGCMWTGLAY